MAGKALPSRRCRPGPLESPDERGRSAPFGVPGSPDDGSAHGFSTLDRFEHCWHLEKLDLPSHHGVDLPTLRHLQHPVPDPKTVGACQEVHAQAPGQTWIIDEGETDADEVEVAVDAGL